MHSSFTVEFDSKQFLLNNLSTTDMTEQRTTVDKNSTERIITMDDSNALPASKRTKSATLYDNQLLTTSNALLITDVVLNGLEQASI